MSRNQHIVSIIMFQIRRKGKIKFNDGHYGFDKRWFIEDDYVKYLISTKKMIRKIKQQLIGNGIDEDFLNKIKILGGLK